MHLLPIHISFKLKKLIKFQKKIISNLNKVKIIGAGLSGLTAAYYLKKSQPNLVIEIIEKNDRPGGRLLSKEYAGGLIEYGAFMIMPWYENYKNLFQELKLSSDLIEYKNFKQVFAKIRKPKFSSSLKFFGSLLPDIVKSKIDVHQAHTNSWQYAKASDYFLKSKNQEELEESNDILEAYTYPDLSKFPASLYFPFAFKMESTRSWQNLSRLKSGSSSLINALFQNLKSKNVQFEFKTEWNGEKNENEKIIIAANLNKTLWESLFGVSLDLDYTHFIMASVELPEPVKELGNNWHIFYNHYDSKKEIQIEGIANCKNMFSTNKEALLLSIRVPEAFTKRNLDRELESLVEKMIKDIFPSIKTIKIIELLNWEKAMPIVTSDDIKKIEIASEKQEMILAVDTFQVPCMETAVYSGLNAARKIDSEITKLH